MTIAIPLNGQTWLICGGRSFADQEIFDNAMSKLVQRMGCPSRIVHGAATGADEMAQRYAERMAIGVVSFPADWSVHWNRAGPIRNQRMLDVGKPAIVIAFPGGRGTADMVRRAHAAREASGTPDVIEIKLDAARESGGAK